MKKTCKRIVSILLSILLVACLLPNFAFADEPEQITVYTRNSENVWVAPPAGTVASYSTAEVPSQYGTSYYTDARCMDIYLTGVEDNASFNITMHSDILIDEDEFEIERFLSTIGYVKANASSATDLEDAIWDEVHDIYSETDDSYTFPVQLENGEATFVVYYYWSLYNLLYGGSSTPVALVLNFHVGGETPPEPPQPEEKLLKKIAPAVGQFENENALYGLTNDSNATFLIVPADKPTVDVTLTFSGNDFAVSVNDVAQGAISADNTLIVTLNATMPYYGMTVAEAANTIKVSKDDKEEVYTLWVVNQRFDDLPDSVVDYLCVYSQYTNNTYGVKAVRSLVGSNRTTGTNNESGPVSLGNFGGYITYYFEDAIEDKDTNPYGVDFIVYGNCFEPSNAAAEPGQVYVSEDGETWYALAGSMHYEDYADWGYEITYTNLGDSGTGWSDNREGSGSTDFFEYPDPAQYPWHTFAEGEESSITLTGICFIPNEETSNDSTTYYNMLPRYGSFGYVDVGMLGTVLSSDNTEEWGERWVLGPQNQISFDALARNIAGNPYAGTETANGTVLSSITDGMDLAWAVNDLGQPVSFPNGVHYVKIVTASNIYNDMTFEKSTEVNMVRVAQPNSENVGTTSAPSSIKIDGVALELVDGQNVYSATVDGPFKVEVEASEDTYVFVNNYRGTSVNFNAMPTHGIIRVIVQQGEKEPVIYVINLTETTETPAASATLTLDANGGTVNGNATYTMNFDANMAGDPLPTPLPPDNNFEFAGWYKGLQPVDSIPAVVEDTTFVAHWAPKQVDPGEETVGVSFRLIGSTKATADIELDKAQGEDPYNGAEYVTWIKTTPYTLTAGSTVADLIVKACGEAGLAQSNAQGGYVATVTAPAAYGGYELSEFTNGPRSGWMYTIGEAGTQHPGRGVAEKVLSDGDVVILHYVNDYAWEVADWAALGGSGWPSLYGDDTQYLNGWMQAEDDDPPPYVPPETPTTPEEPKPVFEDVPEDAWFAEAVDWAVENGITTGTTETTFEPELDCTRAQVVTFLWRAAGEPKASAANPFTDVAEGSFYYDAVLWAVENGITTGVSATEFAPDAPCTRGQVVTFLWRAAGKPVSNAANPFADVADGSFYYDAVVWAVEQGVTTGTSATTFEPDLNCTRAQVVTFMWREAK